MHNWLHSLIKQILSLLRWQWNQTTEQENSKLKDTEKTKDTETQKNQNTERWKPSFTKRIGRKYIFI